MSTKLVTQPLGCCLFITLLSALLVLNNHFLPVQSLRPGSISTLCGLRTNQDWSPISRCYIQLVSLSGACPAATNIRSRGKIGCGNFWVALLLSSDNNANDKQQLEEEKSDERIEDLAYLKTELQRYLQVREEKKADELSKAKAGTIIGGSKGNAFLEYISAVPTTPLELEESYPFDYDELTKYGFSHCVKPIMQLPGGRRDAYKLMDMIPPRISSRLTPKKPREIKLDFEGKEDLTRYQGMRKMTDDDIAQQLEEIMQKKKKNEIKEEESRLIAGNIDRYSSNYEIPFSNRKNISTNRRQPEWTAEQLDEEARRRGKTYDWARKVREEKEKNIGKKDLAETIDVHGGLRVYAIIFTLLSSIAYGKATPPAMEWMDASPTFLTLIQGVALILLSASIVSSIYSSVVLAPPKNRNSLIWAIKGFAGGPPAVFQLKELNDLPRNV